VTTGPVVIGTRPMSAETTVSSRVLVKTVGAEASVLLGGGLAIRLALTTALSRRPCGDSVTKIQLTARHQCRTPGAHRYRFRVE
jgi:hypothetical protein